MGKPGGGGKPSSALAVATVAPSSALLSGGASSAGGASAAPSSRALVLGTTADGRPDYSAVVRQGHSADVIVAADHAALVPKLDLIADPERHLARPDAEDEAATVAATRAALDAVVSGKIASVAPKNVARPPGAATYIKYTPKPGALAAAVSGSAQPMTRIVKMQEMPVDPLEPPKFRHTKAPRGPGSPPVPVMHSPPRKVSAEEAANWKVPPCVSNWKNAKGYTIPLDKRLAADGRGLQETAINDGFAKFAEALYVAEHSAREAVELRAAVGRELASKEREAKERQLRELAAAARAERVGGGGAYGGGGGGGAGPSSDRAPSIASVDLPPPPPPRGGGGGGGGNGGGDDWSDLPPPPPRRTVDDGGGDEDEGGGPRARGNGDDEEEETPAERAERRRRDEIRAERKRERERELRLVAAGGKRSRGARDADRDISDKVALGQAALGGGSGSRPFSEAQYDQRLFNQDGGGLDAGLGAEDSYNLYDKPLFADRGKSIYRPRRGGGDGDGGEDEGGGAGGGGGRAFKPDVGFAGADGGGAAGGSSGPVRFERMQPAAEQQQGGGPSAAAAAPADDPFGIDAFVSSVSSKRDAAAKKRSGSGSMRAAGGGGSAEDYLEGGGGGGGSSRSKVAFERGKGT